MPVYQGELLLTGHSTGSLTSKAIMKHFNRENELLADTAESAAVTADVLGAMPYPGPELYRAWDLTLGSQMHDMLPGTCLPRAYDFTWNDEVLALNQFASVAESSSAAVAASLDTQVAPGGVPIVVFNPLSIARQDVVEASITLPSSEAGITVFGPNGVPVPTQVTSRSGNSAKLLFLADAPAVGYAVYEAPARSRRGRGSFAAQEQRQRDRKRAVPRDAGRERRRGVHLRQGGEQGTAASPGAAGLPTRKAARVALLEHGLGRSAEPPEAMLGGPAR